MIEFIKEIDHFREIGYTDTIIAEKLLDSLLDIAVDYGIYDEYYCKEDYDSACLESYDQGHIDGYSGAVNNEWTE
jgi:hypothetical protein